MKRAILSMFMMLGLLVSPALVGAQPVENEPTYTSEFSGDVIDLGQSGDVFFLADEYSTNEYTGGWEEFIWVQAGGSNFQLILVGGENTAEYYSEVTIENMEAFYDEWELVDQSVDEDRATFVGNAVLDGAPVVIYFDFVTDAYGDTDFAVMQFSWSGTLEDDLELVQDEVTINDEPILADVDAGEIAELGGEGTTTDDGDASPVTTPEDEGGDVVPVDGLDIDATPEGSVDEGDVATSGDWESMGLVSDSEWESPTFGNTVTWDANWMFPEDYELAIIVNDDPVYDSLTLETTDDLGYVFINVEETGPTTPSSQAEFWNSPEFADRYENGFELVEVSTTRDTATVIYQTTNNADQDLYVVLMATFLEDGNVVYSQISAAPDTIGEVYEQYVNGIEVDGAPLGTTYTVDEIYEVSGN